jgi:hypothetical protein
VHEGTWDQGLNAKLPEMAKAKIIKKIKPTSNIFRFVRLRIRNQLPPKNAPLTNDYG